VGGGRGGRGIIIAHLAHSAKFRSYKQQIGDIIMINQLIKIADFLDKSNRNGDADVIDYIINKYAGGDLDNYFEKNCDVDIPPEEREVLEDVLAGLAGALGRKIKKY
jgi:hypothetical protein